MGFAGFFWVKPPKSPLHGCTGHFVGGDLGRGLRRQRQVELLQEYLHFFLRLRVAGQDHGASVGRGQMHVHHLHPVKLFQHGARGQTAGHGS